MTPILVVIINIYVCIEWNLLESAGDGGLMVIGLSGSLGDGDGSRLVIMAPTTPVPLVCKCCIGCMGIGGGGERRPLTPGINALPWWLPATMVPWFTLPAAVPFCWSPSTGKPFSDRNSSRSQYWKRTRSGLGFFGGQTLRGEPRKKFNTDGVGGRRVKKKKINVYTYTYGEERYDI